MRFVSHGLRRRNPTGVKDGRRTEDSEQDALVDVAARGRAESGLAVEREALLRHLRRLHSNIASEAAASLHAADLVLAFACSQGDADALAQFERDFGPDIDRMARRGVADESDAADVAQRVRLKVLFPPPQSEREPGAAKISTFNGRGPLRAWVRVVCSRMIVDEHRDARETGKITADRSIVDALGHVAVDPGTQWIRDRYRDTVKAAMEAAFVGLSAKDRRLLRGVLVQRMSTESVGIRFGVHRTTAARWVEDARRRLVEQTQMELRRRIGPEREDALRSLVALVRSTIDLSVVRLLESTRAERSR